MVIRPLLSLLPQATNHLLRMELSNDLLYSRSHKLSSESETQWVYLKIPRVLVTTICPRFSVISRLYCLMIRCSSHRNLQDIQGKGQWLLSRHLHLRLDKKKGFQREFIKKLPPSFSARNPQVWVFITP